MKRIAPGEARTHGLQIMRLTRCLLRYGGILPSKRMFLSSVFQLVGSCKEAKETIDIASAGNRTRVNCLEGSYAHHYTTDAFPEYQGEIVAFNPPPRLKMAYKW